MISRLPFCSLLLVLSASFWQCTSGSPQTSAEVEKEQLLDSIPSASGMVLQGDTVLLISDDAPFIYYLSLGDFRFTRTPVDELPDTVYRIPKEIKPDFEASVSGKMVGGEYLFSFGSGSQSPERDTLLVVDRANRTEQQKFSLTALYRRLQEATGTPAVQWNLEGAALAGDTLYLFNRGSNGIIALPWKDFTSFATGGGLQFPPLAYDTLNLPALQGKKARFSGACTLDEEHLLFSASVEDTPDWITDGPVLGSYIGVWNYRQKKLVATHLLRDGSGHTYREKVESVEVLKKEPNGDLLLAGVIDNDNGTSKLVHIRFRY